MRLRKLKSVVFVILFGIMFFLMGEKTVVWAGTRDNAYEYYSAYGNQAVFLPTTETDGVICFCSSGSLSTSGTRYRTIGWKMDIMNASGAVVQSMYYKLGGAYMSLLSDVTVGGYEYKLYGISLSSIKSRMDQNVYAQFAQGNCRIELNACMVVVKNGVLQGQMNDYGVTKGTVYTTLAGIKGAANWSQTAKTALESYYGKNVQGLYYYVSVQGTEGIAGTSGAGVYCYGTHVTVSAWMQDGYEFAYWDGSGSGSSSYYSFYVNANGSFVAHARRSNLVITYYRNWNMSDSMAEQCNYQIDGGTKQLLAPNWNRTGYSMSGWSYQRNVTKANLKKGEWVSSDWLRSYIPAVSLYAVWTPNQYTFVFDGNGGTGQSTNLRGSYEGEIVLKENPYTKMGASFKGWSLSTKGEVVYSPGTRINVANIVTELQVASQNNATITWYAIWDEVPSISGYDLYYSLDDARNGIITEEELAKRVSNFDLEDGVIAYGNHDVNHFLIKDYEATKFTGCTEDSVITVEFTVKDSAGNIAELPIDVHVVDTSIHSGIEAYGKVRCIDEKYFMDERGKPVAESLGGLKANSIWLTQMEYTQFLKSVLCQ